MSPPPAAGPIRPATPPALRPLLTVIVTTALARDLNLTAMGDALDVGQRLTAASSDTDRSAIADFTICCIRDGQSSA